MSRHTINWDVGRCEICGTDHEAADYALCLPSPWYEIVKAMLKRDAAKQERG